MKSIRELSIWFLQQKRNTQWMIGGFGLLFIFSLCLGLFAASSRSTPQAPAMTATYNGADSVFYVTWTPATTNTPPPTSTPTSTATPVPTHTSLPTGLPTQRFETATLVVLPTNYSQLYKDAKVYIIFVDKELEYVDIQNAGGLPVSLDGWTLVSEVGEQVCPLKGILLAKEILRIWAATYPTGFSCGFKRPIWLDQELDPAVLYNTNQQEISRYPVK